MVIIYIYIVHYIYILYYIYIYYIYIFFIYYVYLYRYVTCIFDNANNYSCKNITNNMIFFWGCVTRHANSSRIPWANTLSHSVPGMGFLWMKPRVSQNSVAGLPSYEIPMKSPWITIKSPWITIKSPLITIKSPLITIKSRCWPPLVMKQGEIPHET